MVLPRPSTTAGQDAGKKEPEADGKKLSAWAQLLHSEDVVKRQAAVLALAKMGPEAAPALALALSDRQVVNVRLWAAHALGWMGPKAKGAVPALAATLKDDVGLVRVEAARALWKIDKHKAAVPALAAELADKDADTRYHAAQALEEVGPDAKVAAPALVRALTDTGFAQFFHANGLTERRPVSQAAARALRKVDPALARKHEIE